MSCKPNLLGASNMSRMSCMSPKGIFQDNNLSISIPTQGENPPHDKHDKHDNYQRMTTTHQTNPHPHPGTEQQSLNQDNLW